MRSIPVIWSQETKGVPHNLRREKLNAKGFLATAGFAVLGFEPDGPLKLRGESITVHQTNAIWKMVARLRQGSLHGDE
jgi:hypothetical protein